MPADEHVAREPHLAEIEAQWGPVPGKQLTDGRSLFVMGAQFGSVFVGVQPGFGYEGDPMRLLFERGFTPTHAFTAFYRWIREDFGADALLHFGTHGALEFMPGKQVGMGEACWPQRLIGDTAALLPVRGEQSLRGTHRQAPRRRHPDQLPHAADHPCGPLQGPAGTERSIERWRAQQDEDCETTRDELAALIQNRASALDSAPRSRRGTTPAKGPSKTCVAT
jgi:magnesium chelatase subunit H